MINYVRNQDGLIDRLKNNFQSLPSNNLKSLDIYHPCIRYILQPSSLSKCMRLLKWGFEIYHTVV